MIDGLRLFTRFVLRPLWREPARTALTLFAVALGVGVVIAMDIAGQSAAEGFHASVESLAGNADAEITITGGIPESLLGKLTSLTYAFSFSARVEDFAFRKQHGEAIPFIGLDLIGDPNLRNLSSSNSPSHLWTEQNPIWAGSRFGWTAGQHIHLTINDQVQEFTVAGILTPEKNQLSEGNVILADIGLAQQVTSKIGRLDSITVTVPGGMTFEQARTILQPVLPAAASMEPRGMRREQNRRMLDAFRWNLRILSYISLLVGAFLIYNTVSISVVRRRPEIGVVRALGMSKITVLAHFIAEALFFGSTGSAFGVLLGRIMANAATAMVNGTVQSLYVTGQSAGSSLSPQAAITGITLGLLVAFAASLAPAIEASQVPPVEAMARGRAEFVVATRWRITLPITLVFAFTGLLFAKFPPLEGKPVFGYLAVLCLITATAAAIPGVVTYFTALTAKFMRVEGLLAARSLRASLGRTSILTATLTTAVAMTTSVGIMVGSFRTTLDVWMNDQLHADFYLRPASIPGADRYPTLSADLAHDIAQLPFVQSLDLYRAYPIVYNGLPATLAGGNETRILTLPIQGKVNGEDLSTIAHQLATGDYAFVSEPFASKHNVHAGSILTLALGAVQRRFRILAVYYDYSTERGLIMLDRRTLLRYLPDPALSSIAVYLKPGTNPAEARLKLDQLLSHHAVFVAANRDLRRAALQIVDNTFRITYALEAVAIFVAVMGVAGALLALIIDRKREFGLLRFLGASQSQIRAIILSEAALLGLLSNALGLLLGSLLSLILIFVINKQSFGWTLQFHWPVLVLLTTLTGVYVATVLAALYPSRIALRLNPIEVIHEE